MKRILLLITFLFILTGILYCEEYDMNRIMPKKLIYTDLPDDYPKELDELFTFYWDTVNMMENWQYSLKESYHRYEEYYESVKTSKKYRLAYLIWLAGNSIPEYYTEYLKIHVNPQQNVLAELYSWEELERLSIFSSQKINNAKTANFWATSLIPLSLINRIIIDGVDLLNEEEYSQFYNLYRPIWIRVKIIEANPIKAELNVNLDDDQITCLEYYFLKVKVIEAFGDVFQKDILNITIYMLGSTYNYQEGQDYLINCGYGINNMYTIDEIDFELYNINPLKGFKTQIFRSWEIIDNKVTHIPDYSTDPLISHFDKDNQINYDVFKGYFDEFQEEIILRGFHGNED